MLHRGFPVRPRGLSVVCRSARDRAAFTLVELLVVIAIISVLTGALIPTVIMVRKKMIITECANNLREIGRAAMIYADSGRSRFFPLARGSEPRAHESLNVLVNFYRELEPRTFLCGASQEVEAEVDENGRFELDEETCSYAYVGYRLSPTEKAPLAACKHVRDDSVSDSSGRPAPGHDNGINVVYTDGSVRFVYLDELGEDGLPPGLVR